MAWDEEHAGVEFRDRHFPFPGPAARLGAVAFIHRFGSALNAHLHFHCVVIDGMFDAAAAGGVIFRAATGLGANATAQVQVHVRRRLLRVFVRRGLMPADDAQAMGQWKHGGGFSVDGSVRIEATDRAGRERLLRYCARPLFVLDRLRELDRGHLIYDPPKPGPGGSGPQCLTPLELLDRLAALKRGGRMVIVDHSAKAGADIGVAKTLHRIDPAIVVAELTQAGFVLETEGQFLRNPSDSLEVSSGDGQVMTDKFVLRFVKPN
jgi:hypothetical protein